MECFSLKSFCLLWAEFCFNSVIERYTKTMLLQPRKFKFKTKQKTRSVLKWTYTQLNYGDSGIKTLNPLRMSSRQIFRMKVLLKKAIRKPDLTRRLVWFNTFPHLPLTKKSKGMRMGKGAGKLNAWQTQLRGGVFIFEFKNLRPGRALYYFKRMAVKFPTKTKVYFRSSVRTLYFGQKSLHPRVTSFW